LNFLLDQGGVTVAPDGTLSVAPAKIRGAVEELTRRIMTLQAHGDYDAAKALVATGVVRPEIQKLLDKLDEVPCRHRAAVHHRRGTGAAIPVVRASKTPAKAASRKPASRGAARRGSASRVRWWPRLLIVAAAIALVFVPAPESASTVDRLYSRGVYGLLQPLLTSISSLLPVAWLDLLLAGAFIWLVLRCRAIARAAGSARRQTVVALVADLVTAIAALYIVFLAAWGLNYRRLPITATLDFDQKRVTREAVERFAARAVDELNRLYMRAHADPSATATLAAVRVHLAPGLHESAARSRRHTHRHARSAEALVALAVLSLGDGGRDDQSVRPRGARQSGSRSYRASLRRRARVGPPGRLGARERSEPRRLDDLHGGG
jgi:hypothetical protein